MSISILPPTIGNRCKVYVCCHKADSYIRNGGIYVPIQVGAALSNVDLGFLKDNEGNKDNISEKNRKYNELTALYWMWKNKDEADYVGLCHYRRYFVPKVTSQFVMDTLENNKYDVITCRPVAHAQKNIYELSLYIGIDNFLIMTDSLSRIHPECYEDLAYLSYLSNQWTPCNMFISSRKWMNEYCEWLFPVLEDLEKRIPQSAFSRANRAIGYIGEFLLSLYLQYSKSRVKCVEMSQYSEVNGKLKISNQWMTIADRLLNNIGFNLTVVNRKFHIFLQSMLGVKTQTMSILPAVVAGLKADGIDISSWEELTEEKQRERAEQKQKSKLVRLIKLIKRK